jgi:hypothetical protein
MENNNLIRIHDILIIEKNYHDIRGGKGGRQRSGIDDKKNEK